MGYVTRSAVQQIKDYDTRNLLEGFYNELDSLHQATGTNFLQPVNSTQAPAAAAPAAPSVSASGSNGAIVISITPPSQSINKQLYYEVSCSALVNFTAGVTTMAPTVATTVQINSPGLETYIRVRASYDQKNWSTYAYA